MSLIVHLPSWEPIFQFVGDSCGVVINNLKKIVDVVFIIFASQSTSMNNYEEYQRRVLKATREINFFHAVSIQIPRNANISHKIRTCQEELESARRKVKKWKKHIEFKNWKLPKTKLSRDDEAEIKSIQDEFLRIAAVMRRDFSLPGAEVVDNNKVSTCPYRRLVIR